MCAVSRTHSARSKPRTSSCERQRGAAGAASRPSRPRSLSLTNNSCALEPRALRTCHDCTHCFGAGALRWGRCTAARHVPHVARGALIMASRSRRPRPID
eukprot:3904040-Prymnesium_polylepis.1